MGPHHAIGLTNLARDHHSYGNQAAANHLRLLETILGRAALSSHFMGHVSRSVSGHLALHLCLQQGYH
jgi:hypothetical protein